MVLIFWPNFRLAVLIELVLIKKSVYYQLIQVDSGDNEDFALKICTTEGTKAMTMLTIEEKDIYISLIKQNFYRLHVSEIKWGEYFSTEFLVFKEIWLALQNNIVNEKTRSCIWEQIHLNFFTTYWFNKISKEENICPLCKIVPKSMKHIILECDLVKKLWKEIEEKLMLIVPEVVTPLEMAFGLTKDITKPEIKIRNWITFKLRETISKQERTTYDKPHVNNEKQIRSKFNKEIVKEMTYRFLLHKKEDTLDKFVGWFECAKDIFEIVDEKIVVVTKLLDID